MMNNPGKQLVARDSGSGSMPAKLAGLFAISFPLFFILFFAYDLLTGYVEKKAAAIKTNEEVQPIVVDPKIANDLASVLSADPNPGQQDVKDAFFDRGGLNGKAVASANGTLVQVPAVMTGTQSAGSVPHVTAGAPVRNVSLPPATVAVEGTKERYQNWLGHLGGNGDVPLDPRVFAIEDLLPVGIVDGGSGQQEVMFFSQAAGKTISFPVGTMFFDGWLTELRPEGVVFSSNDDRHVVRMRSWARSVKSAG